MGRATATQIFRCLDINISIHALRGEGDCASAVDNPIIVISIHALRGEGDLVLHNPAMLVVYFNPRPPWGGRQRQARRQASARHFNPRPPWGGRRKSLKNPRKSRSISIHALRGEGDFCMVHFYIIHLKFQSTPSVGRATVCLVSCGV